MPRTAAVYIRTMPQSDGELYRKGLLRNATRSKRGIFIGRHARQNLFDLLMNDEVSAKDAEVICQLTQNLTDEARVEEIQSRAAGLLREGRSWEYIGAMTQLLANKERVTMRQGLLDLGADFQADLDKMARCIELNMQALKNAIRLLKMGRKLSRDNRAEAERLGVIATTSEDSEGKLRALTEELTRWEYIGSYPDLIAAVQMWDGETKQDPVGKVMERYEREVVTNDAAEVATNARGEVVTNEVPEGQGAFDFSSSVTKNDVPWRSSAASPRGEADFSASLTFSPAERSGLRALRELANGAQEARFRSDTLGQDVVFPLGNAGAPKDASNPNSDVKGAFGFMHLITMRMAHGESLEEACYTACKAVMAAVNGRVLKKAGNSVTLTLDGYNGVLIAHWQQSANSWVLTGYKQNGEKSSADDRRRALRLAASYAPDSSGSLKEVGAALDYAIPRLAREYKQNHADPRRKAAKRYYGDVSFSVAEAKERGLMKDGRLEAANGFVVDGGADFSASVDFSHVSRALFRRPDREHVGTGFGAQCFGWGVMYGATNPKENKKFFDDATIKETLFVRARDGRRESVSEKEALEELARRGVTDEDVLWDSLERYSWLSSKAAYETRRKRLTEDLNTEKDILERAKRANDAEWQKNAKANVGYLEQEIAVLDYLIENDIYVRKGGAKEYPVNYRMRADVDDGNLLHWNEDGADFLKAHPDVAKAMEELPIPDEKKYHVKALKLNTGKAIYSKLQLLLGSPRAASEWLDEHGIRGVKYADFVTDYKRDKTYNYVIFNPDYIEVIAINNRHEWSEYSEDNPDWERVEDVDFSSSVRGEGLLDRVNLREMAEEEKMSRLMTRARRGAARWRRVFMDDRTSTAEAARALGEVSSVMEAVFAYLPAGERPSYAGKMRLVEAYARLVETGRVWHRENAKSEGARAKLEVLDEAMAELERVSTVKGEALRELREGYVREVAGRKLSEVAVSMVEDAVDAVERHLVRREMEKVRRLAEALKPRKRRNGKPAPGKMSAEGYRRFGRYMKMVQMSAEAKAERMEELAGKLDKALNLILLAEQDDYRETKNREKLGKSLTS